MFRKTLFWIHLTAGLVAGLAIAMMCATGVVLSFEKQLIAWAERDARLITPPTADAVRLTLTEMTARAASARPNSKPSSITVPASSHATVIFSFGRDDSIYLNPYTGEARVPASTRMRDFMHTITEWHRWLGVSDNYRTVGKVINGVANAAFCLLAISGLYLWMPRTWSWRGIRAIAFFNWRVSGKARDFNWHNSIGLWSAPVLIVLTLTALPISFRWANNLIFQLAGEQSPAPGAAGSAGPAIEITKPGSDARPLERDALLAAVQARFPAWQEITFRLASPRSREGADAPPNPPVRAFTDRGAVRSQPVTVSVKLPSTWPRTATTTASLNPFTGDVLRTESFADLSTGRRVRTWTRFLHTGEALGWPGQLIAGLATLGGCFLVYTGFALSWRRFFRRNNSGPL